MTKSHALAIALGRHYHARETVGFEYDGRPLRFAQTSAVVGLSAIMGRPAHSGIMVYRVRDGQVDAGTFAPLDASGAAASR